MFRDKLDLVITGKNFDESKPASSANVKLIIDNIKPYATTNFDTMLKPFVAKIEDITRLREPKMRNFKIVSKLQKIEEEKDKDGRDS